MLITDLPPEMIKYIMQYCTINRKAKLRRISRIFTTDIYNVDNYNSLYIRIRKADRGKHTLRLFKSPHTTVCAIDNSECPKWIIVPYTDCKTTHIVDYMVHVDTDRRMTTRIVDGKLHSSCMQSQLQVIEMQLAREYSAIWELSAFIIILVLAIILMVMLMYKN